MWWLLALSTGFMGSFHCIGMCGPLQLALPQKENLVWFNLKNKLIYNLSRVISYMILGAIFGLLGQGLSLAGFQQKMSILAGIILLVIIVINYKSNYKSTITGIWSQKINKLFTRFLTDKNKFSWSILGFINGFLPCGLVYIALAIALSTESVINATLSMALFGLATIPGLIALSWGWTKINFKWRSYFQKISSFYSLALAFILILRGLNLGIPMISPKIEVVKNQTQLECCENPNHKE